MWSSKALNVLDIHFNASVITYTGNCYDLSPFSLQQPHMLP